MTATAVEQSDKLILARGRAAERALAKFNFEPAFSSRADTWEHDEEWLPEDMWALSVFLDEGLGRFYVAFEPGTSKFVNSYQGS